MLLWALLLLVLVRGLGDIVADAGEDQAPPAPASAQAALDGERAFAARVARVYLGWGGEARGGRVMDPLLASELRGRFERTPPRRERASVLEATVADVEPLAPGRALVTVECLLAGGPVHYVAVPVARDATGGIVAFDLPALVAGPPAGDVEVEAPAPLAGPEAGDIDRLVRRFLAAYVGGAGPEDLTFFVAPGTSTGSLAPGLELSEVSEVGELPGADPERRSVLATVEVRDAESGAAYPARYRLELVRRERWYVESIRGEAA